MQEAMRALVHGIVASYDARAIGLASIRRDVSAQRERDRRHVQQLQATRLKAARTLRSHLTRGRAALAKVHTDLNRAESRRQAGVHSWMEELASAHQAMAQELRADLSKGRADLGASVSAQLQELDEAHQAMARQQQETLAEVHSEVASAERQRKSEVETWMEEVAATHGAAREEWQNLAGTMRVKRAGGVVAEAPPAAAPATRRRRASPVVEEKAVEVGEATEEVASLTERVFTYLANHPDGIRLTELERELGLGRFHAARVVKQLMNDGKAEKQGLLYFAT